MAVFVIHVYLSSLMSYESSFSRKPMFQGLILTNDYVFNMVFFLSQTQMIFTIIKFGKSDMLLAIVDTLKS